MMSYLGEPPIDSCLSDGTQRVLDHALNEVVALGDHDLSTEHLLVGLLVEPSEASGLLSEMGITLEGARNQSLALLGRGSFNQLRDKIPVHYCARRALALAVRDGRTEGHRRAEPINLLRGILKYSLVRRPYPSEIGDFYGWCGATLILQNLGVSDIGIAYSRSLEIAS